MTSFFFTFFKVFLNGCLGLFVPSPSRLFQIQKPDKLFFHFFSSFFREVARRFRIAARVELTHAIDNWWSGLAPPAALRFGSASRSRQNCTAMLTNHVCSTVTSKIGQCAVLPRAYAFALHRARHSLAVMDEMSVLRSCLGCRVDPGYQPITITITANPAT
jgi:hypothetical protein